MCDRMDCVIRYSTKCMLNNYNKLYIASTVFVLLLFPYIYTYAFSNSEINLFDSWDSFTDETTNVIDQVYLDNSKPGGSSYITVDTFNNSDNLSVITNTTPSWFAQVTGGTQFYNNGDGTYNTITYHNTDSNNGSSGGPNTSSCPPGTQTVSNGTCCPSEYVVLGPVTGSGKSASRSASCDIPEPPTPPTPPTPPVSPPTQSQSCTPSSCESFPNICGEVNSGTQCIGGSGSYSCNAPNVPNPSGVCTVQLDSGVATGVRGCGAGVCYITRYPTESLTGGSGDVTWVELSPPTVGEPTAQIFARPILVKKTKRANIVWLSAYTKSCSVSGSNGDGGAGWSGINGDHISSEIVTQTTYNLTCEGLNGEQITDSVTVRLVPEWQEI